MGKKSSYRRIISKSNKEKDAKAGLALGVVILAFVLLMFVFVKKDELIDTNTIKPVTFLVALAMGVLVTIIYLAYKPLGKKRK